MSIQSTRVHKGISRSFAKARLVSDFFTETDVALFFKRKVLKKCLFEKKDLYIGVFPASFDVQKETEEMANSKAVMINLVDCESIRFHYLHSLLGSNCERNRIEIHYPSVRGKKGKKWKLFTGCDKDMTVWEQSIRSSRLLAKKCISYKVKRLREALTFSLVQALPLSVEIELFQHQQ